MGTLTSELQEMLSSLEMPYHQILEPFFTHSFLRLHPIQLGVDAVALLAEFIKDGTSRKRIFSDLKLGTPKAVFIRPSSHSRDRNDLELIYEGTKEENLPKNEFAEVRHQHEDETTKEKSYQIDFTIKTCAGGEVSRTLELLIGDMERRKRLKRSAHGLLIFFLAGHPPNIPDEDITLKTRFFMVLVAIPLKVIGIMEKVQQDEGITEGEARVGLIRALRRRIDGIIVEKKEKENMAVLNVISPERSLVYYTTNRVATISVKIDQLETDVATLKGDVATLKGDVATLKGDVADIKNKINLIIDILNKRIK